MRGDRPSTLTRWPKAFDPATELDWGEPVMSRRLLREHLDQSHDGASRRTGAIRRHLSRLLRLLPPPPADILDAACGPGLYAIPLARRGHHVVGIDVGGAVLRHARGLAGHAGVDAVFRRGDLRNLDVREAFDAVLLVYFVLEGFTRTEQARVLRRLGNALRPGGTLIVELRTRPDQPPGRLASWEVVPRSLHADRPHLLLTDTTWDERRRVYVLREVAVFDNGRVAVQQTTGHLRRLADVDPLFGRAGLHVRSVFDGWTRYRATGLSETLLVVAERPAGTHKAASPMRYYRPAAAVRAPAGGRSPAGRRG